MSALNNNTDITYNCIRYRTENTAHQPDEQPAFPLSLPCWWVCRGKATENM